MSPSGSRGTLVLNVLYPKQIQIHFEKDALHDDMDSSEPDQDLPQGYPQQVLVDETRDLDAVFEGPNSFKIAIATDNHLGFMERDPIRGNDSFEAFEEFLKIASQQKVLLPTSCCHP